MGIQLQVFDPRGRAVIIDLCDNEEQLKKITVRQLKEQITKELLISCDFRIICASRLLEEDELLVSYGIRHMATVHTMLKISGGGDGRDPGKGDGGMGDKEGKNRSMERLFSL